MLTQLATVKSRLALAVTDYDDLLMSAIKAISDRLGWRICLFGFIGTVVILAEASGAINWGIFTG